MTTENTQLVALPAQVVQAVGDYLAQRPWAEVNGLLNALQQAQLLKPAATEETTSPPAA